MAFWALEVIPGKDFATQPPFDLHLTQVVLPANATDNGRTVLQAKVDEKQFAIASLKLDRQENMSLDLIFEAGKQIHFSVTGKNPVQLLGYFIDNNLGDMSDDEGFGDFDDEEMDDEEIDSEEGGLDGEDDDDEDDDEIDEEEIRQAIMKANKRKPEHQQDGNGKKAKVEGQKPQQQQQQQKGQQQQQQQKGDQKKGEQKGDQKKGEQKGEQKKGEQQKGQQQQQKPQTPGKEQQQKGEQKTPKGDQKPQTPGNQQKGEQQKTPGQKGDAKEGKTRMVNGVKIDTTVVGLGGLAQMGKKVGVMYTGRLENGKVFDKSDSPFSFRIGAGEVIKGWDIGVNGMRVGEKRRLTIPPALAYGSSGAPPDIPRNATLVFDVELVRI